LIVLRSLIKVQDGYSFSHDPRLVGRSIFRFSELDNRSFISGIKCPLLLFWTKATVEEQHTQIKVNKVTLQQIYQERVELLNPAITTVVVLEEGSHHVHLDLPDLVLPHIEKLFEKYLQNPSSSAKL